MGAIFFLILEFQILKKFRETQKKKIFKINYFESIYIICML